MTDESKQWVAVTVLVFRGAEVLTMQRSTHVDAGSGLWEGVSGRVRPSEDPLDAARREVVEETGLEVSIEPRPVDTYAARRGDEPMTVIVFRGEYRAGEVAISHEHQGFRWVTLEALGALGVPTRLIAAAKRAAEVL